jgi:arylsulfatase A-like enzyme
MWSSPRIVSPPARRFNVVVMLEDAQRADYLSVYGHPHPTTPFKERLMAERGILFELALSQATQTRPSVGSFMTSLYPTASGVWSFSDVLSDRHLTLAEIMRHQGYATAAFVQNGNAGPFAGMHQGFDQFLDPFAVGGETATVFGGPPVEDWLREHLDQNFFLYLHVIDPHGPYEAPEPIRAQHLPRIAPDSPRVPRAPELDPDWIADPSVDSRRRLYEAEIEANDREVERFFALLDELGLAESTLVIMASSWASAASTADACGRTAHPA